MSASVACWLRVTLAFPMQESERRLESWKEIATYLGVFERTAWRYEENAGLPVHRLMHEKRGKVFRLFFRARQRDGMVRICHASRCPK